MNISGVKCYTGSLLFGMSLLLSGGAFAEGQAKGNLVVKGKSIAINHAYAYMAADPFGGKPLTFVLLCDAPVSAAALHDEFESERKELVSAGKLSCVQQRIDAEKHVINFGVRNKGLGAMQPDGGSTEHVFEAKTLNSKTIAGRAYTKSAQMSFDDVPYSYDITFSAPIDPGK